MIALATDGSESTSPRPTSPSSVWTRTTSPSWLPSPIDVSIAPLGRASFRRPPLDAGRAVVARRGRRADIALADILGDQRRVALGGIAEAAAARGAVVELVAPMQDDVGELARRGDAEGFVEALEPVGSGALD